MISTISRLWPMAVVLALVGLSVWLNVDLSSRIGALSSPSVYDDVGYLLDGYRRFTIATEGPIASLGASFLYDPPHAPMNTVTAMLGYWLLGPHIWAPYLASAWMLATYAVSIYLLARLNTRPLASVALVALMLFVPVAQAMVTEFRPDMGAGLFFSIAIYLLVSTRYAETRWSILALVGCLAALAIMAKPTAVIATVPILGIAFIIGVFGPYPGARPPFGNSLKGAAVVVAAALVFLIPFAVIWGGHVAAYLYQVFVTNRDIWSTPGSALFHWTFHSFGSGGRLALRFFLFLGIAVVAVDVLMSAKVWRQRDTYNALAVYAVLIVLYCAIATSAEKTVYQGSLFYFPFLMGTVLALSRVLGRAAAISEWAPIGALASMLIFATLAMPFAAVYRTHRGAPNANTVLESVVAALEKHLSQKSACAPAKPIIAALAPNPLTPDTIALAAGLRYHRDLAVSQLFFKRSEGELWTAASLADFILVPNVSGIAESQNLPATQFIGQILKSLDVSSDWTGLSLDVPDAPKLFARVGCRTPSLR